MKPLYSSGPGRRTGLTRELVSEAHNGAQEYIARAVVARSDALLHEDALFFARLAFQRILRLQTGLKLRAESPLEKLPEAELRGRTQVAESVHEFVLSLEFGFVADANDISDFFYHSLVVSQHGLAHSLAVLHPDAWPSGSDFVRWQTFFGFSTLRGEEVRTKRVLNYLEGLCFDAGVSARHSPQAEFQRVTWRALDAIYRRDAAAFATHLKQRVDLWPQALTEEQRNDCLYLYDLTALGFIRLAQMRGMQVTVTHPDLPLGLLDATPAQNGAS